MRSVVLLLFSVGVAVSSTTFRTSIFRDYPETYPILSNIQNDVQKVEGAVRKSPEANTIFPKTLQSQNFANYIVNVEGSAVVMKSNLPQSAQDQLAAALTSIYQSISDPMQRLQQFQTATTKMYQLYWNVVSNFDNITFYSQYFIYLRIDADSVLAFGIS